MEFHRAQTLINKFRSGAISEQEMAMLESWYLEEGLKTEPVSDFLDYQAEEDALWEKIQHQRNSQRQVKLWPKIAVAAAIVIILSGVGLFYFDRYKNEQDNITYTVDVNPGRMGATLTLANGKQIRLTDALNGELAREAGVEISKEDDGQVVYKVKSGQLANQLSRNTLRTGKGETYMVILPDQSKAWLNAGTNLSYNTVMQDSNSRVVYLEGEAYFEISKLKSKTGKRLPFVVMTPKQEVEVLGTHFNINSYDDEPVITTTLLEGSVKVSSASGDRHVIIKPGQQVFNNGNSLNIAKANIENTMDWKQGDFYLDKVNFKTAMRKIARWYNVDVVYDASVPDDIQAGGWISRDNKLSDVLRSIARTGQVKFKIEGRKIIVSK